MKEGKTHRVQGGQAFTKSLSIVEGQGQAGEPVFQGKEKIEREPH